MLSIVSEFLPAEVIYQMSNEADAPIGMLSTLVYRRNHEINSFKRLGKGREHELRQRFRC